MRDERKSHVMRIFVLRNDFIAEIVIYDVAKRFQQFLRNLF